MLALVFFTFYVFLLLYRSEIKLWSPLSSEGGKTHPYKMNLESEPKVCVCVCFPFHILNGGNFHFKLTVSERLYTHFPSHPQQTFFLLTANDEVIVYFPTAGFLGDSSLSARVCHRLQFLPTEWKLRPKSDLM